MKSINIHPFEVNFFHKNLFFFFEKKGFLII